MTTENTNAPEATPQEEKSTLTKIAILCTTLRELKKRILLL